MKAIGWMIKWCRNDATILKKKITMNGKCEINSYKLEIIFNNIPFKFTCLIKSTFLD